MISQPVPMGDPEKIRTVVRDVLADPDFKLESTERIDYDFEWLKNLFEPIGLFFDAIYAFSPVVYFLLLAVLFVALGAMMFHIVYSLKVAMQRRAGRSVAGTGQQQPDNPDVWFKQAQEAYESGDFLLAIRLLLNASLLHLELTRRARFRRAATNREYLCRYRNTSVFPALAKLVEITDSRWYGGVDCSRGDVEDCFRAHDEIRDLSREDAVALRS